jgi:hypothetical protein
MILRVPHLIPVGASGIPRADAVITRTIETLRSAQFIQDPLFDSGDSFRLSLMSSAIKREGVILEAAIMDAIEQHTHLRLLKVNKKLKRVPDVQFELRNQGWMIALEIKRGSQHDSKSIRAFHRDLVEIPPILRTALPLFPAANVHFHIVFVSGVPRIKEGLTLDDLWKLYGLQARSHIMTARQRYSAAVKAVLRERGL